MERRCAFTEHVSYRGPETEEEVHVDSVVCTLFRPEANKRLVRMYVCPLCHLLGGNKNISTGIGVYPLSAGGESDKEVSHYVPAREPKKKTKPP